MLLAVRTAVLDTHVLVCGMLSEHGPLRELVDIWLDVEGRGRGRATLRACRQWPALGAASTVRLQESVRAAC
jgi:hypothetical protein